MAAELRLSFDRLCGFVAIRQSDKADETLRHLLIHVIALNATRTIVSASDLEALIREQYDLTLGLDRIQSTLDRLLASHIVVRGDAGALRLDAKSFASLAVKIEEANALEAKVRQEWLEQVSKAGIELDGAALWAALSEYLRAIFQQHGVQTLLIVMPRHELSVEYKEGLTAALNVALGASFTSIEELGDAKDAVELFFEGVRYSTSRIDFLTRLADSSVSYYSLTVPPDIAERLRKALKPLMLFLDTNALFALVGLGEVSDSESVSQIIKVVREHRIPFQVRIHEDTQVELTGTLEAITSGLKSGNWSAGVSRVAASRRDISSVQRVYHTRNAESPITAESFFEPYRHIDELVRSKGVTLYRDSTTDSQATYDLLADYTAFSEGGGRRKSYETLHHDIRLLDCVRKLRSKAASSLDAGALFVTTDFLLHRFDAREAHRANALTLTILPTQLLQLLRPFVPETADLDRSFAEAFASPAFRSIGGRAKAATARLLELLSAYQDITEETATEVFANDMIRQAIDSKRPESEVRELVESVIALENAELQRRQGHLMSEKEELRRRLESAEADALREIEKAHMSTAEATKEAAKEAAAEATRKTQADADQAIALIQERMKALESMIQSEREEHRRQVAVAASERVEHQAKSVALDRSERRSQTQAVIVALFAAAATHLLLMVLTWPWLDAHPNQLGLRFAVDALVGLMALVVLVPNWRKTLAVIAVIPLLYTLLPMIGGKRGDREDSQNTQTKRALPPPNTK